MYKCFCGKDCKNRHQLALHLTMVEKLKGIEKEKILVNIMFGAEKVNYLIEEYKNEKVCLADLIKMGYDLSLYLTLLGLKRTPKQEKKTKRYLEKYEQSCMQKYGIKNPSQLTEIKEKKKETFIKNYGVENNFSRKEIKEKALNKIVELNLNPSYQQNWLNKYKTTCLSKYGTTNVSQDKNIARKIAKTKKERFSKLTLEQKREMTKAARSFWNSQNNWESNIEKTVHKILDKLNIKYEKHVDLYGYNYDILINNEIIIEVNGDFWHANPLKYKADDIIIGELKASDLWEKDERKRHVAKNNHKKYHTIWESDIINSSEKELFNLIKNFLE